jgi:hypothetical protein
MNDIKFLDAGFHIGFLNIIKAMPRVYYNSMIRALVILFPHDLPDVPKPPYGWEHFAKKIPANLFKPQEIMDAFGSAGLDALKTTVVLAVMDVVCAIIANSQKDNIGKDTYDLILRHVFFFIHTFANRSIAVEMEGMLFDKAFTRCAVATGYIANGTYIIFN